MADVFSKKKRSDVMSRIRSKDTKPEIKLRTALHRLGYRYRLHVKDLPGKPDIVLPKYQAVIQVRGCFWHSHTCIDGHIPKSRREYWVPKLQATKVRDKKNDARLRRNGWRVLVVWECTLSSEAKLAERVAQIEKFLRKSIRALQK